MQRFVAAFEQKKAIEYSNMFTGDFTYEFSNATDPDLVTKYSTGWFRADEAAAASHMFQGYVPPGGQKILAARSIDINLANTIPVDDNGSSDPVTHKVVFTRVDGMVEFPPDQGQTKGTTFLVTENQNAFYLV